MKQWPKYKIFCKKQMETRCGSSFCSFAKSKSYELSVSTCKQRNEQFCGIKSEGLNTHDKEQLSEATWEITEKHCHSWNMWCSTDHMLWNVQQEWPDNAYKTLYSKDLGYTGHSLLTLCGSLVNRHLQVPSNKMFLLRSTVKLRNSTQLLVSLKSVQQA